MTKPIDGRTWLKTSMAAVGSVAVRRVLSADQVFAREQKRIPPASSEAFRHRGYLGWITDSATEPDSTSAWPSMRLDERLLGDYQWTLVLRET